MTVLPQVVLKYSCRGRSTKMKDMEKNVAGALLIQSGSDLRDDEK
jgi:hypothetical protein